MEGLLKLLGLPVIPYLCNKNLFKEKAMKRLIFLLIISIFAASGWCLQETPKNSAVSNQLNGKMDLLEFYRQYSSFTDPGDYAYLYENLPGSLPALCSLIKSLFIHPQAELPQYREQIPKERWNEAINYPTVQSILKGLMAHDSRGLVKDRKPEDRLVLGCREYAILLASIMKYRGIPARVRAGHAAYLHPEYHLNHTICEVWHEKDKRWMLVDPGMDMIDFRGEKFDFSNELWLKMQKGEIDPGLYGIPGRHTGLVSIVGKIPWDLASILGTEYPIYQHGFPPILEYAFKNDNQLTVEHMKTLNRISELMKSIDVENLLKLREIYNGTPSIQMPITHEANGEKAEKMSDTADPSTKRAKIEFADMPAGTFLMGSPVTEHGRKEDETQHEVALSAFKMSKYPVTFEQFDMFCEATGRRKPWGRERGNLPVTQVTWYDAAAFAEWMGCRLPTEAEFEYAARAHTTTPFYTGDCLTSEQANFNGQEPYINCEKGIFREKALPVGSFSPNAFGLYDMHGNIWEWTDDWYGEYDIQEKMNPKGPKTGTIKVHRSGGFYDPAWRCRSACRGDGGSPPENRGQGISFRLVKSE